MFSLLCKRRGWDTDYIDALDNPHYDELLDMDAMVAALHTVRTTGQRIVVLPDFDMDGITAGTLGWAGLAELGFDVRLYIPDYKRGHDIAADAVSELHAQFPTATAVITCDGGVNSHDGIGRGKDLGLTMLITDHHVQLDRCSPADVIVDPERIDDTYSHPGVCGAFVLHQVLMAYARAHRPDRVDAISLLKLFAGIGTVSDVMPLFYENRQLVRDSLSLARLLYVPIAEGDTATVYDPEKALLMVLLRSDASHAPEFISAFEGFAITLAAFREQGKIRSVDDLNEGFYGFYAAPAFNSIRRVEGSMADAFGVFTAPDPALKMKHIQTIIAGNEWRKEMTPVFTQQMEEADQPLAPWIYTSTAPAGMLGLLASNLMNQTGMPVVVVNATDNDNQRRGGSARSPFWFPIITTMGSLGFTVLGHENACGIRLRNQVEMAAFAAYMRDQAQLMYDKLTVDGTLAATQACDLVLGVIPDSDGKLDDVEELLDLAHCIETMRPFGHGFARPVLELGIDLSQCSITTLGSDETHIKIVLRSGLKLLWWGMADAIADLREMADSPVPGESLLRVHATISINRFRGFESVQATIESLSPGQELGMVL